MTDHEALFSLLRQANPVPDPAALVETPADTVREALSERNETMTTTPTIGFEAKTSPPRRRRPLALAATAFLVVLAGFLVLFQPGAETAAPSEVGVAFFETINDNDAEAWWALHAEDAIVFGEPISDESIRQAHQDYFDWRTTVESRFEEVSCAETGEVDAATGGLAVSCDYVWRGAIQDRLGVELPGYMLMAVEDGKIVSLSIDSPDFTPMTDLPVRYLGEHHPVEFAELCGAGPGSFNGGAECARLYMDNLDGMAEAWEAENG